MLPFSRTPDASKGEGKTPEESVYNSYWNNLIGYDTAIHKLMRMGHSEVNADDILHPLKRR